MQNRLLEAASYYTPKKRASRIAVFDMAYPTNSTEYNVMNGFGILWVTVLVQDTNILPVEITLQGSDDNHINLIPLHLFRTIENDRRITRTLGKHRLDGIYLLPLLENSQGAALYIEFAVPGKGFVLGNLENEFPDALGELYNEVMDIPEETVAEVMLVREYPVYAEIIGSVINDE